MTRRWNANTWVLIVLGTVLVLSAVDVGRRMLAGPVEIEDDISRALKRTKPAFKVGDPAPEFRLPDRLGKMHTLSELVRRPTMVCFLCGCNSCREVQTYMGILVPKLKGNAPDIIGITTAPPESEDAWKRDTRLKQTMLYERKDGPVMQEYRGHPCPRVFRLTADRKVAWFSPSPAVEQRIAAIGHAVAENLGFQRPDGRDLGLPVAPRMRGAGPHLPEPHPVKPARPTPAAESHAH